MPDLTHCILFAEDDDDDYYLIQEAFAQINPSLRIERVKDGEELMEYLAKKPHPDLILLDLNMPRRDGREALKEIKTDPNLCHLPVIVFTTSNREEDVAKCYRLGGNSFIRKPSGFSQLTEVLKIIEKFWFQYAALPQKPMGFPA